ncbi:MAG TPA: hypothetical protein VGL59_00675 [Polyangia bacterium]|jgi:hypothetical protein
MIEAEVLEIVRRVAGEQSWPYLEPVLIKHRRPWLRQTGGTWEVFTNRNFIGGNIRMVIDDDTGAILSKGFMPR